MRRGIILKQALLVIDAQQELMDGNHEDKEVFSKTTIIATINKVIKQAQEVGVLIIFVRDQEVAEGKGAGFQVHNEINIPTEGALFIDKIATNSFYKTNLLPYLKEQEIGHLVIMGCKTEYCIDTAVRAATVNSFDVTLVEDGHTTSDSGVLSAEKIIAHHNQTLHGFDNIDHFSIVRKANERLFEPIHDNYR